MNGWMRRSVIVLAFVSCLGIFEQWMSAPAIAQDQDLLDALGSIQEQRAVDRRQSRRDEVNSRCRCVFNDGCGVVLHYNPVYPNTREGDAQRAADERRVERHRQWRRENAARLRRDRARLREWCFASRDAMDQGGEPETPPQMLEYGGASAAESSAILIDILADMDRRERDSSERERAISEQLEPRRQTPQERAAILQRLRDSCAAAIEQSGANGEWCSPSCQSLVEQGYRMPPPSPSGDGVATCN